MRNLATRSQKHAQAIFAQIDQIKHAQEDEALIKRYGSLCHRFPILVLRSGLAQAVGFLQAKAKGDGDVGKAHERFLTHLAELLGETSADDFQQQVYTAKLGEYRRLTREALAAAVWYKRFAQSVLDIDPTEEGNGP